jgi:hypothetical protein
VSTSRSSGHFEISPIRVAGVMTLLVIALSIVGTIANICIYHVAPHPQHKLAKLMQRFDLGHEPSIPALYSALALFGCALLLWLIGTMNRRSGRGDVFNWFLLAGIFLMLGLDEAVMFHEMLHNTMRAWVSSGGIFFFPWVIPGIIFVTIVAVANLRFLSRLESRTRWLFIAAGAVFVGGAVGMELLAGVVVERHGVESLYHTFVQTIEETLEMLGVVIFTYSLLDYFRRHHGTVRISAKQAETRADSPQFSTRPGRP